MASDHTSHTSAPPTPTSAARCHNSQDVVSTGGSGTTQSETMPRHPQESKHTPCALASPSASAIFNSTPPTVFSAAHKICKFPSHCLFILPPSNFNVKLLASATNFK
ncbi:hypothetical protein TRVL_10214 [Trypanosoma vivax]|nr:hypothetical protein TRVL_10214 [Trypanosoma vivax]